MAKKHQKVFLLAGFGAAVVAGLLYLEMRTPVYLQGTSNVRFGYTGSSVASLKFFSSWPFASTSARVVDASDTLAGGDEVGMGSDVHLYVFLADRDWHSSSGRDFDLSDERARQGESLVAFNFLIFSAVASSIGFAIILASDYDLTRRAISFAHALVSLSICGCSALEDRSISSEAVFLAGCGLDVSCFDRLDLWTAISYRWTGIRGADGL